MGMSFLPLRVFTCVCLPDLLENKKQMDAQGLGLGEVWPISADEPALCFQDPQVSKLKSCGVSYPPLINEMHQTGCQQIFMETLPWKGV